MILTMVTDPDHLTADILVRQEESPAPISHTPVVNERQRLQSMQEVAKAMLQFKDRENVHEAEEQAYVKLDKFVNAGRPETMQVKVKKSQRERTQVNLVGLKD